MRIDSYPLTSGAPLRTTCIQFQPLRLDTLERMLTQNPLGIFSPDDWDILCILPACRHWGTASDSMVSDVCNEEYKIVNLTDILDDETEPPFITDAGERAELEEMRLCSPILCIPPRLRVPLGHLLEKVACMNDEQEKELSCMLEYAYECLSAHAIRRADTPRFLEVLDVLQRTPLWAAYLRAGSGSRPARRTRKLVSQLSAPPGLRAIFRRPVRVLASYARTQAQRAKM